ncbi:MAG: polyprenol monophosphomannose synthase [Candidatus Schekmanbacteria bacterium]|nr:polyprenol monophosphomannose synthase [Candidatus Schekmanbacteria bacterium]
MSISKEYDLQESEVKKTLVVIPTYNERENIAKLTEQLLEISSDISILIVDDDSPDGTGKIADELTSASTRIKAIHRKGKGGRGSACVEGFKYALANDFDYVFEMDADFSHNPQEIPLFFDKIKSYDMVIGSRYLKGSKIVDWTLARRVFSKIANFYARTILGIPISDYTNGYRIYKKKVISNLDFEKITSKGYIVLSEMAYQVYRKGFRIGEVPTLFVNRKRGQSNLSFQEIYTAFTGVLKVKFRYLSS